MKCRTTGVNRPRFSFFPPGPFDPQVIVFLPILGDGANRIAGAANCVDKPLANAAGLSFVEMNANMQRPDRSPAPPETG
jgi:hypothetical protein